MRNGYIHQINHNHKLQQHFMHNINNGRLQIQQYYIGELLTSSYKNVTLMFTLKLTAIQINLLHRIVQKINE